MNNDDWIVWNELVKSNYDIKHIIIYNCEPFSIYKNSIELKIEFKNNKHIDFFKNLVKKKHAIMLKSDVSNDSFELELKKINSSIKFTDKNILEDLDFPSNVDSLIIINSYTYTNIIRKPNVIHKVNNLPKNLLQLKIIAPNTIYDLSNLPISIIILDISECIKANLDYLPEGLKILYLPEHSKNYDYVYNLSDLSNLPISLIEIHIGSMIFSSIGELLKKLNSQKF